MLSASECGNTLRRTSSYLKVVRKGHCLQSFLTYPAVGIIARLLSARHRNSESRQVYIQWSS
ncbi:hypothetical protein D3C86_1436550 [compost metagenome]